jgi:ribosomal protein S27AE
MTALRYCKGCFEKQQQINELVEENARLKAQVHSQERSVKEGAFGSSTPSSKIPIKANTLWERQARCGGTKPGHPGHGREALREGQADRVERVVLAQERCPQCDVRLLSRGLQRRSVIDLHPVRVEKVLLRLERKRCPKCGRRFQARAPGVLPKSLYGNALLTHVAEGHYLHGIPLGVIERPIDHAQGRELVERQTGLGHGSLVQALRQVGRRLEGVTDALVEEYRRCPVKHADETGWRTDGQNGYVWLFATETISLFRFRQSRSAAVAREVLGSKRLPGVLVVDRYHGYNKTPCAIEYCYAHLKRDTEGILKDFPDEPEVAAFVEAMAPTLAEAMTLRTLRLPRKEFRRRALRTKRRIIALAHRQARHPAIWKIQKIFRENAPRLYHWARDPTIPAENNLAERDLRPLVIARKVSFGSQSEAGARTRETLMSVLHTLKKRRLPVPATFQAALDRLAENPSANPATLLFKPRPRRKPPSPS